MNLFKRLMGSGEETVTEQVRLDTDSVYADLIQNGMSDDQANTIIDSIKSNLNDVVKEKRTLSYEDFTDAVTNQVNGLYDIPQNRIVACQELEKFVRENPEVYNSIKLYASYIIYGAADIVLDEYKVAISGDNTARVKEAEKEVKKWEHLSKIRRTLFPIAKELVTYGDAFLEKLKFGNENNLAGISYIPSKTIHIKLDNMGRPVKYYQVVSNGIANNSIASLDNVTIQSYINEGKVIEFDKDEIAHFNDGSVAGVEETPFYNIIVLWKFLKMLEQALVIHRMTRSRRFVVFFLDVTGKTKKEIRAAVGNFTGKLKSIFRFDLKKGNKYSDRSTIPSSSDLVVPITKDSATKVQNIPSDPSASKIEDLKFYLNRLITNLLTSNIFSERKTGKEEYVEKAFMRMVRIYQKQMQFTLQDLYEEVLKSKGFNDLQLEIIFPAPDSQQEIKIVDTIVRRMMIINQMIATLGISPPNSWIVNYVFKDLTQFESKELINLLEFEEQKQKDTAEGEEYPSLFEEDDWGNSAATDNNENIDTFEQTNISSNILQQMLKMIVCLF